MLTRKKLLFCLVSLIAVIVIVTTASASTQTINNLEAEALFAQMVPMEVQRAVEAQEPALKAYMDLTETFEKNEFEMPIYPENYAGGYIDENNKLVVLVVSQPSFLKTKHFDSIRTDKNVIIKEVEYSYNYLASLRSVADKLYKEGIRVVSDGVDIRKNEYLIKILTEDYKKLSESGYLDKISSGLPVRFEEDEEAVACTSLWGGRKLFNEDNGFAFTLGICGKYLGADAIVTCGHGNENFPYIKDEIHRIGRVAYQQANTDQDDFGSTASGDFAIVPLDSDTTTNYVLPGVQITDTNHSVPVGTTVYKYGAITGYSWGTVEEIDIRLTYSNGDFHSGNLITYHVSGLYRMNMTNANGTNAIDNGDSGGPVWTKVGSNYILHGIVTAAKGSESPKRTMFTTPINYVRYRGFAAKTY